MTGGGFQADIAAQRRADDYHRSWLRRDHLGYPGGRGVESEQITPPRAVTEEVEGEHSPAIPQRGHLRLPHPPIQSHAVQQQQTRGAARASRLEIVWFSAPHSITVPQPQFRKDFGRFRVLSG